MIPMAKEVDQSCAAGWRHLVKKIKCRCNIKLQGLWLHHDSLGCFDKLQGLWISFMIPLAKEVDQSCAADSAPFIDCAKKTSELAFCASSINGTVLVHQHWSSVELQGVEPWSGSGLVELSTCLVKHWFQTEQAASLTNPVLRNLFTLTSRFPTY